MSTSATEVTLAETATEFAETQTAAFAAVRQLVVRHVLVGILSALGTTFLIRKLGPQLYGAYGVAYLLLVTMDSIIARGILAGLSRKAVDATAELVASAARLALYAGVGLAVAIVAVAPVIRLVYHPPAFSMLIVACAIACVVYAARAVPGALLERELRYGPIAASEIGENLAFYAVAIPAILLLHYGLAALMLALVARSVAALVVIRWAHAAPWLGRSARDATRMLLPYGLPLCMTFVLAVVDGLVAVFVMGDHQRQVGYVVVAATVLGYGVAIVTAAARVALPSFSRVDPVRLGWSVRRSVGLATFLTFLVLVPAVGLAGLWVSPIFGPVWDLGGVAYFQLVGVGLLAAGPIGVLSGALLGQGDSRRLLGRHALTIAVYVALAVALVAAFGPIGGVIALAASRWFFALVLGVATREGLGFHVDRALVSVVAIGAVWLGVALFLTPRSAPAAVVATVAMGGVWVWASRDLAGAALKAAGARFGARRGVRPSERVGHPG